MLTRGSLRSTPLTSRILPRGGAHPKRLLLTALVAALVSGLLVSAGGVRAQATNSFQTRDNVPAGGIMTVTVSTANVFITASSPVSGCPVTGTGGATVTYTCSASSGGIGIGTPIFQTFSVASGPISELVTYNQNGGTTGIPGFPAVTNFTLDTTGTCTPLASSQCGGLNTSVVTVPNSRLDLLITPSVVTQSVTLISPAPLTFGSCTQAIPPPVGPVAWPATLTYSYDCSPSQSVPAGTPVTGINLTVTGPITPAPTFVVKDNALFPLPAIPAIPPASTQTIAFGSAAAPILSSINPSSGTSGTVVTLQGSGLTGVTGISFGSIPATNVNCVSGGTSCTVTAPNLASGTTANVTVVTGNGTSGSLAFDYTSGTVVPPAGGVSASYAAGWNIVGGPSGTIVTGNSGPLYTYQAGDTQYEVVTSGSALAAPRGYWAFFNSSTTSSIVTASPQSMTVTLPPLQWIMVGNPGNTSATVSGADIVYTYNGSIYVAATSLLPGQGGWAISNNGGTLTIRN